MIRNAIERRLRRAVLVGAFAALGVSCKSEQAVPSRSEASNASRARDENASAADGSHAIGAHSPRARGHLDATAIGKIIGTQAKSSGDGVVRVTRARKEVPVSIDGVRFPAAAGLTSWAAFATAPDGAMLMGDTVVFQDEVSPAMDAAFAHNLEITALHNHFFYDEPKVYFMHIGGHGEPNALARGVKAVWDAIADVRRSRPKPAASFPGPAPAPGGSIDSSVIKGIIGAEPSVSEGVTKVTIERDATMHGARFAGSMGLTTWAAFTGSDELAVIDGDFAMTQSEVQPVLRALRAAGIHVVALHNHMIGEKPAYYFTHFWAKGPAPELAHGFRAALDAQRKAETKTAPR